MSREDFLPLLRLSLAPDQIPVPDTLSKGPRRGGLGQQQSASRKQPKRHLVVTRLRQFWSRKHLNQEFLRVKSLSYKFPKPCCD